MIYFKKSSIVRMFSLSKFILILALWMISATPASAHISPVGCTGSGLGINLFTDAPEVNIGDTVSFSVLVFNGAPGGPTVCDATGITASVVTPDGVNHPITLTRTALSDGESDFYPDVVSYVAAFDDMTSEGTLAATASDTGTIHQNIANSTGGGNQGLNVYVLNTLNIIKVVINNGGGTATASDFDLHVTESGTDVAGSPDAGTGAPGTQYSLIAGTYEVSEDPNVGYVATFSGDCDSSGSVELLGGEDKTCTITNDDIAPASLTVNKTVINDDGGTKTVANFPLFVGGTPVVSGATNVFPVGPYAITETVDIDYTQTFSGDCDLLGNVTLAPGDNKVCTITNNDIPPLAASINVVKVVVNDNGGTKVIADFPLFVNGTPVASGATNIFVAGSYTVTETSDPNYTQVFSGDCSASGGVVLLPGENKFCIITNDDIAPSGGGGGGGSNDTPVPPLINVVKVPDPLALPDGPGPVTYTYTLHNIGKVAVRDITMVGDTCSPIVLVSGDIDSDERLDFSETWIYKCTTTLPKTHTNIVTATGWANGISAVDVASATVIVGVPNVPGLPDTGVIVPPLIYVTKVPEPLVLPVGGGTITYTNIVTNPGTVPLSNVNLKDDKCTPVSYVSGDTNGDLMLDPTEAWAYICQTNLTRTTTNTVIAEGSANGMIARDLAIATVVVSVPGLPNTGYRDNMLLAILIPVAIFIALFSLYRVRRKKIT